MLDPPRVDALLATAAVDPSKLAKLLTLYRPYLRLIAEQSIGIDVRRREDASDVIQQTELEAAQAIANFRGATEPEFSAWIKQILRRNVATVCRNHRAAKRDIGREQFLDDKHPSASLSWRIPAANAPSPAQQVMRGEAALELAAALEKLPDQQRIAVRMRHLEGMKIDDVAAEMGITAGAAAGFIRRGVEGLRKKLQGDSSWL